MNWRTSLAVAVLAGALNAAAHELPNAGTNGDGDGGDFTLLSADGAVSTRDFRGRLLLLFFGYTACVDVCPATLWVLSNAFAQLTDDERASVSALFASLDPTRDTPAVLRDYTALFHDNIIGVTGDADALGEVLAKYEVNYQRKSRAGSALGYVIYHTPDVFIIDRRGRLLQQRIDISDGADQVAATIRTLLQRPAR